YANGALVSAALLAHAPAGVQAAWLPKIASGEALVVLAHQERAARHRLNHVATSAKAAGSAWTVSGAKSIVPVGDRADAFVVPAATFQALRHRIADVKMQLELGRSMSYFASLKLGEPPAQRRRALSQAKLQLGNSMRFVGQQCVQLHGGIGVTEEYAGSHYFKRLTVLEMTFGDTMQHLGEVAARMQDTAGVFA